MSQIPVATPQMGFGEAISTCFKKIITFTGRARRSEYWWWALFAFLANLIVNFIPFIGQLVALAIFIAGLAVAFRRLHDIGKPGWWVFIPTVCGIVGALMLGAGAFLGMGGSGEAGGASAIIGGLLLVAALAFGIVILIWTLQDGKPEANQYGESPKYKMQEV